jgi:hypothetical protein
VCIAAPDAVAADAKSDVSVDYSAPAQCPRDEEFRTSIEGRARVRFVAAAPQIRAVFVRIAARAGAFEGHLSLREPDGSKTERAVSGATCAEVASGLAIVAAVAIDMGAPQPESEDAAPAPEPKPNPPPTAPAENPMAPEPVPPPKSGWAFSLGADVGVGSGVTPERLLLVPPFLEFARETEGSIVAPAARLRFTRAASGDVAIGDAGAQFTWMTGSLDLCPLAWTASRFSLRPCGRIEAGELEVRGRDIDPARRGVRPWLALGPVARGRVVTVGPLFAELELAANIALVRDRFYFEPDATAFRAPIIGWTVAGGAGVGFR